MKKNKNFSKPRNENIQKVAYGGGAAIVILDIVQN